jgi:late competence protein required for DNA uptake (superfamily II DNA/RNA helicase)
MEFDFEKLAKFFMGQPLTSKKERATLHVHGRQEQIYERSFKTLLNEAGLPETIEENNFEQLDDGTTMADVAICQKCGRKVRIKSLRRCPCGSTCCIYCRKVWLDPKDKTKERDYCSLRHVVFHHAGLLQRF